MAEIKELLEDLKKELFSKIDESTNRVEASLSKQIDLIKHKQNDHEEAITKLRSETEKIADINNDIKDEVAENKKEITEMKANMMRMEKTGWKETDICWSYG